MDSFIRAALVPRRRQVAQLVRIAHDLQGSNDVARRSFHQALILLFDEWLYGPCDRSLQDEDWPCARGAHVVRPGPNAMQRERSTTSPPRTMAINPNTTATAPPTTPLPLPGPPVARAKTNPPLTTVIGPNTRAVIAPRRPWLPIRRAARYRARPTNDDAEQRVAQSRRGVRP